MTSEMSSQAHTHKPEGQGRSLGPNLWKAALVREELQLPYSIKFLDSCGIKKEPYVNLNPNGRFPAIKTQTKHGSNSLGTRRN